MDVVKTNKIADEVLCRIDRKSDCENSFKEDWRFMDEVRQARQGLSRRSARPRRSRQGSDCRVPKSRETE